MMAQSMYGFVQETVNPLEEFLKALVELNARKISAEEAGWGISLSIDKVNETVSVEIVRANWKAFQGEE